MHGTGDGRTYGRAIAASVVGNVLEWFDFGVYGYLASTISQVFFPDDDPATSLLSTLAIFGVGFVTRPLGSILFGIYGDRRGRRKALSATIFVMALSTFIMGLLPTYAQVGVLSPILLVLVRLLQGLSVGGEWGGSTTYIAEFATPGRRGFFGSWQLVGVGGGFLLGSMVAALLNDVLSDSDLRAWGWRLPFLAGISVGAAGAYLRWRLDDTPKYLEIKRAGATSRQPLGEALGHYLRPTSRVFAIAVHGTVGYYIANVYMSTYRVSVGKLPQQVSLWIGTAGLALYVVLVPVMGWASDRLGRRPLMIGSCVGHIVLGYPLFLMASRGTAGLALVSQLLMIALLVPYSAASTAFYAENVPTRVRCTALSIGYNTAAAIFGGFAPFIAAFLVRQTGSNLAPAAYVVAAAALSGSVLLRTHETAFSPLR